MHVTVKVDRQLFSREELKDVKQHLTKTIQVLAPGSSVSVLRDAKSEVHTAGLSDSQKKRVQEVVHAALWFEGAEEDESDFEYEG